MATTVPEAMATTDGLRFCTGDELAIFPRVVENLKPFSFRFPKNKAKRGPAELLSYFSERERVDGSISYFLKVF